MTVYIVIRCRQAKVRCIRTIMFTLLCLIGGIISAKLMAVIHNWDTAMEVGPFAVGQSIMGPVFYGILLVFLAERLLGFERAFAHILCAPSLAILIAFQRVGCFFEGCCGGIMTTLGNLSFRWPAQIMESIGDFLIFGILLDYEKSEHYQGRLYPLFLIYYGILRFFVEFVRVPQRSFLSLSNSILNKHRLTLQIMKSFIHLF